MKGQEYKTQGPGEHCWCVTMMQLPRGNPNKAWIKLAGAAGRRGGQGALEHGIFDILSPCFLVVFCWVFFFLVILLSFCGKKKSLIYSQSGGKNIPQNPLQSHIFHMCEVQCSSLFAKLCFQVGLDTSLLLLLSITGCFPLTYSPL